MRWERKGLRRVEEWEGLGLELYDLVEVLGWNSDYKGYYMKTFSKNRWRIMGWRVRINEGGACFA